MGTLIADWVFDANDPRAPTREQWSAMTLEERERVVEMLPSEFPHAVPEGDVHREAKERTLDPLRGFFERVGRKVYLSSELPVYYPGQPMFAPDLIAVVDTETKKRERWVTELEGRGIDLALEIHVGGDRRKDYERNVEWFARLGVREYFVHEPLRGLLRGWALPSPEAQSYRPILGQAGRYVSTVLGLELGIEGGSLRFFYGGAVVPETRELLERANALISDVSTKYDDAIRRAEELSSRVEEEAQLRAEEARLRAGIEQQLAEALAEIDRLRRA